MENGVHFTYFFFKERELLRLPVCYSVHMDPSEKGQLCGKELATGKQVLFFIAERH